MKDEKKLAQSIILVWRLNLAGWWQYIQFSRADITRLEISKSDTTKFGVDKYINITEQNRRKEKQSTFSIKR